MSEFRADWAALDLFDRGGPVSLRVISLHDHVMNLEAGEWGHMLMIADPEMYRGPASAGLGMLEYQALRSRVKPGDAAEFRDGEIKFIGAGGTRLSLSAAERVSFSVPPTVAVDKAAIISPTVAKTLAGLAAPHLCSCLLTDRSGAHADPFAETLAREFPRLVHSLTRGSQPEFENAASHLIGLGYGSTPTGDDLVHGALIALHYLKRTTRSDLPVPSLPRPISAGTTLLGAHMLEMGARGLTAEPVRDFALDLLAGKSLEHSLAGLRRMGSDSGCSIAVGFHLMALELATGMPGTMGAGRIRE